MPMPTRSPSQTDHGVIWSPLTDVFCDSVADSVAVSIPLGAWTMRCHRPLVIPQGWVQVQVVAAAMPRLKVMRQVPWSSSQRCLILFKSIQSMCFLLCLLDKRWRLSSTSKDNLRQSKTTVLVMFMLICTPGLGHLDRWDIQFSTLPVLSEAGVSKSFQHVSPNQSTPCHWKVPFRRKEPAEPLMQDALPCHVPVRFAKIRFAWRCDILQILETHFRCFKIC